MLLLTCLGARVWHQCHEAGELDGTCEHALVLSAKFRVIGWLYFKLTRDKLAEYVRLLVIDMVDFVLTGNARHIKKVYLLGLSLLLLYHFRTLWTRDL